MNEKNQYTDFWNLLTIALIVLKLTDHIDWSWWWVLLPLWGPLAIGVIVLIVKMIKYILED